MRLASVAAALVVLATLAISVAPVLAATGATVRPPVIKEPFTVLPCPAKPQTTLDLEGCAEKAILTGDRAVDAKAAAIFRLLGTQSARATFVRGEAAWLRYRADSCSAESSTYAGGTLEPVAYGQCLVSRNRSHLAELAQLAKALTSP